MHDVNRDLITKGKKQNRHHDHREKTHHQGHNHNHDKLEEKHHQHHDDHQHDEFFDRAFEHVHDHAHWVNHAHHHAHDTKEKGNLHKWVKKPARDWFAVICMGLLIFAGQMETVKEELRMGLLVMASIIGIYPLFKNSLFGSIIAKKINIDLIITVVLLMLLIQGQFLYVAVISLCMFLGSFLRLNFSWNKES